MRAILFVGLTLHYVSIDRRYWMKMQARDCHGWANMDASSLRSIRRSHRMGYGLLLSHEIVPSIIFSSSSKSFIVSLVQVDCSPSLCESLFVYSSIIATAESFGETASDSIGCRSTGSCVCDILLDSVSRLSFCCLNSNARCCCCLRSFLGLPPPIFPLRLSSKSLPRRPNLGRCRKMAPPDPLANSPRATRFFQALCPPMLVVSITQGNNVVESSYCSLG